MTTRIPLYDASAPVACSIAPEEIPGRIATIERMRAELERLERTEHGLLLHFPADRPDLEADLRAFAVDEKRCCQFWGFAVTTPALALRWDGPPTAAELLAQLERFFLDPDEPIDFLAGLL